MRLKKFITICLAIILAVNILPAFNLNVDAAANSITIPDATYYESGAIKSLTTNFNWDTGTATVRLALMTNRLQGTSTSYGDFTNFGHYSSAFANFQAVLAHDAVNKTFGILSYSDETTPATHSNNNQLVFNLAENAIPLDKDAMYYVYLWTQYQGQCYPDNLFLVINVQDGVVNYTPATGRNEYDTNAFVKVVAQEKYDVTVTKADNMTKTESSGAESQQDLGVPMDSVVYTANTGYYFPENYAVTTVNGIKVTRDSETQITVSGMPTADTQITMTAPTRKLLPLEEMVFPYAYDVQRSPAYPSAGANIELWGLDKPLLANGISGTTNEGNWTLTSIGTYALIKDGEKDSRNLKNLVETVASKYTGLDADTIVLHELKDGNTHIAYGITVAYNKADSMAVFLGDNWGGGAGFLLSVTSQSGTVKTTATEILTDWVAPAVYDITVADTANGTTETSVAKAIAGDIITITATPKQGYKVDSVTYNDGEDHEVSLVSGKYMFEMPAKNVTVKVTYQVDNQKENQATNSQTSSNSGEVTKAPHTGEESLIYVWIASAIASCVVYKCVLEIERSKKRMRRR